MRTTVSIPPMHIKTGDKIRVIAGKDKGKTGTVLQVFRAEERVVVEGVNLATRHLRASAASASGQKITFPSPLHVSNVQLLTPSGAGGRAGTKLVTAEGGTKKIRVIRSKGATHEIA